MFIRSPHQNALLDVPDGNIFKGGRDQQLASAIVSNVGAAADYSETSSVLISQVGFHHGSAVVTLSRGLSSNS